MESIKNKDDIEATHAEEVMSLTRQLAFLEAEVAALRASLVARDKVSILFRCLLEEDEVWGPMLIKMWERWEGEISIPPLPADLIKIMQCDQRATSHQREIALILFIWLTAAGLPIIATRLGAKEHILLEDWISDFSFAVALTAAIMARSKMRAIGAQP